VNVIPRMNFFQKIIKKEIFATRGAIATFAREPRKGQSSFGQGINDELENAEGQLL
jgi:hypothetical protein